MRTAGAGVIVDVDMAGLARRARDEDVVAVLLHPVGAFVCHGAPLLAVLGRPIDAPAIDGADGDDQGRRWRRFVRLAPERTLQQDPAFGMRQLVDIAERALSPGTNDPTTARQCVDRLHDLLRSLIARPLPGYRTVSVDDVVRVSIPDLTFPALLDLCLDEVRHWGASSLQVHERLHALLDDLALATDDPERCDAIGRHRRLLAARLDDLPASESAHLLRRRIASDARVGREPIDLTHTARRNQPRSRR